MKKKQNQFLIGFLLGVVAMAVTVSGIAVGVFLSQNNKKTSKYAIKNAEEKAEVLEEMIDKYYLEEVDDAALEDGIYKGLMSGLGDTYSTYYTAEEYKEMMEDTMGNYCGIGAMVSQDANGIISAIRVFEEAPAHKAGMLDGDIIYKVNDKEVTGEDLDSVVSNMKGEKGTTVKITVYRSSENKYIDLNVTRDKISVPTVSYKMLDEKEGIGYIQIVQFEDVTYEQFNKALSELKLKGMKSLIIDVRNNPGGLYNIVCDILDELLPEGTLVYTMDKYGNKEEEKSDSRCLSMPMVVLQNGNSASASEIFAGAIQDFGAGKIVGTQSFGKGIVQVVKAFKDETAIKLTVSKYYTPKGVNIHGKGITPDVKVEAESAVSVEQASEAVTEKTTTVKQEETTKKEEVTKKSNSDNKKKSNKKKKSDKKKEKKTEQKATEKTTEQETTTVNSSETITDNQLLKAMEVIRTMMKE